MYDIFLHDYHLILKLHLLTIVAKLQHSTYLLKTLQGIMFM